MNYIYAPAVSVPIFSPQFFILKIPKAEIRESGPITIKSAIGSRKSLKLLIANNHPFPHANKELIMLKIPVKRNNHPKSLCFVGNFNLIQFSTIKSNVHLKSFYNVSIYLLIENF
jgi:hypothetical protein